VTSSTSAGIQHDPSPITMCNHISDLPPELRLMVLDRVSRSTLKIICLVNKFWRNLAVPILWGTFVSDLLNNYPRNLDMVLTHRPGSVFTLMRNLHIKKSVSIGQDAFNLKFLQLIMTIAPHTLAEVTVTGAIDRETLGLLIMRQRNLLELSVPMIKDQAPPNHDYVNGNLRSLVKLSMFPNADQAGYEAWLPNMPMLHTLIVSSKRPKQVSLFVPWAITPKMQRLKSLHLHNMTLQPRSGRIDAWTDMYGLYELTIKDCKGMVGFLTDLIVPQSNEKHRLKSIAISETTDTTDWMTNLDNLVHKVEGLQHLYLSSSRQEQTDLAALAIQKHSLTTYLLDPINDWAQFPRADIEEDFPGTLKSCPLIEQLGTSLTHIDFDDWGYTEPWLSDYTIKTSATKTIVQSLVRIPFLFHDTNANDPSLQSHSSPASASCASPKHPSPSPILPTQTRASALIASANGAITNSRNRLCSISLQRDPIFNCWLSAQRARMPMR